MIKTPERKPNFLSGALSLFPRISACGSGCGSTLTHTLTHRLNWSKSKEKVLLSIENRAFWSCWADSNRRPHPYQCEQRLFTAFHKLSKSLILSHFSDFPSRALSFPLIPSNSNKEQIKNKRGSNLGASFCTSAEPHNLLCNDLQIKVYCRELRGGGGGTERTEAAEQIGNRLLSYYSIAWKRGQFSATRNRSAAELPGIAFCVTLAA